ncbi:MAG TPA: hypothetical protein VJ302_31480 [Blastocatellia bacterium]|nr:hypothetical protein [Blastocatellia bacterium]
MTYENPNVLEIGKAEDVILGFMQTVTNVDGTASDKRRPEVSLFEYEAPAALEVGNAEEVILGAIHTVTNIDGNASDKRRPVGFTAE